MAPAGQLTYGSEQWAPFSHSEVPDAIIREMWHRPVHPRRVVQNRSPGKWRVSGKAAANSDREEWAVSRTLCVPAAWLSEGLPDCSPSPGVTWAGTLLSPGHPQCGVSKDHPGGGGAQVHSWIWGTLEGNQAAFPCRPPGKNPFSYRTETWPPCPAASPLALNVSDLWMFPKALESGLVGLMTSSFSSSLGVLTSLSLLPHPISASPATPPHPCLQQIPCSLLCFTIFLGFGKLCESVTVISVCFGVRQKPS